MRTQPSLTLVATAVLAGLSLIGCGKKDAAPAVAAAPSTPTRTPAATPGSPDRPTAAAAAPDPGTVTAAGATAGAAPDAKKVPQADRRIAGAGGRPLPKAAIEPGDRTPDRINQMLEAARKKDAGS